MRQLCMPAPALDKQRKFLFNASKGLIPCFNSLEGGKVLKNIAVACKTLQDEIMFVIRDLGIRYPVLWIESMQHNNPRQLKACIQQQINLIGNVDNIILLFGNCGNAIQGLSSRESSIVFPRVDDCISLFLGGNRQKKELDSKGSAYYLTRGYLEGESNIWSEYLYCVSKYGEEKARKLMGIILKNYEKLSVIDTGAYVLEDILEHTKEIAAALKLRHTVVPGSLHLLYKAFQGKWDEDFNIVAPGESIDFYPL
ncbi:MAG: DUF1638 domain-containing protein [Firmicutes bacterium]|nr:DUF1638 domain-containing protein [Bacillota bacterium]